MCHEMARAASQTIAVLWQAGPPIKPTLVALFVGKCSRSNVHDGAFLRDAT
jgi:hypothetical protein